MPCCVVGLQFGLQTLCTHVRLPCQTGRRRPLLTHSGHHDISERCADRASASARAVRLVASALRRRCHQALKALSETDEWVDAVGCPSHAKIGPEIELPVVPEFVENTRSQYHDTARGIFIAE
jgi:hypothetical protein